MKFEATIMKKGILALCVLAFTASSAHAAKLNVKRMRGIPYGLNEPFQRAIKAITDKDTYYRW